MEYGQDAAKRALFPANIISKARPVIGRQCIYMLSNHGVIPLHASTKVRDLKEPSWTRSGSDRPKSSWLKYLKQTHPQAVILKRARMTASYRIGTRSECEHLVHDWGFSSVFTWADGGCVLRI